jgi:hypothetical protein
MKYWQIVPLFVVALTSCAPLGATVAVRPDPHQAMRAAIRSEATQAQVCVTRVDYIGQHDNGGGATGYIFYVYLTDCEAALQDERFVRVLRTKDGTLHVLAP